jgi:hypothetical protein
MSIETCPKCDAPIVEGRLNCNKCRALYPDVGERDLTWDPSKDENEAK